MSKPIIVIIPETERDALRNAGVLPPGVFRDLGEERDVGSDGGGASIYLWPFSIDYSAGTRLAERMDERPPDIPSFFGIPPGKDDAARMANERMVARLLDGTVVHVVFLERESPRPGYARFGSFSELTSWSRALKRALRARFTNEAEFQRTENVLVVVSSGEQAKPTPEELDDFKACFGEGQAFRSCYFLDYMLQSAGLGDLFHSKCVWDIVVARLLLAFLLAQETERENDAQVLGDAGEFVPVPPFWRRAGIRIWRALECRAVFSSAVREKVSSELGGAYRRLQGELGEGVAEASVPLEPNIDLGSVPDLAPSDGLEPNWRQIPRGGWADFDQSGKLLTETENEARWKDSFQMVSDNFSNWLRNNPADSGRGGVRDRFQHVHFDPRHLFSERKALFEALERDKAETERTAGADPLAKMWDDVTALTKQRADIQLRLRQECHDFSLARNHYVGWGMGVWVAASISCLCGWVLFRIVAALGISPMYSLLFGGTTFVGALCACWGVLWLHDRSGRLGALACARTSLESDQKAIQRDKKVRDLVRQALIVGRRTRLRGQYFRAWALLDRTERILHSELQPQAASVATEEDADDEESEPKTALTERESFVRLTCHGLGEGETNSPLNPEISAPDGGGGIEDVVHAWWEKSNDTTLPEDIRPRDSFLDLWQTLCSSDTELAGYFPAKVFAREISTFVANFAEAVRRLATRRAREGNIESFQDKLKGWLASDVCAVNPNQFATAAFTAMQTNDVQRRTGHVWFVADEQIADPAVLQEEARHWGQTFQVIVRASPFLSRLPQLGFFFQEFDIGLGIDEQEGTGRLTVTEASHV